MNKRFFIVLMELPDLFCLIWALAFQIVKDNLKGIYKYIYIYKYSISKLSKEYCCMNWPKFVFLCMRAFSFIRVGLNSRVA